MVTAPEITGNHLVDTYLLTTDEYTIQWHA